MKPQVELLFVQHDEIKKIDVDWFEGMVVRDVIKYAPVSRSETVSVGIFGQQTSLTQAVFPGDRIEIYDDLIIDPKEARRHRAQKKLKGF